MADTVSELFFFVNGQEIFVTQPDPEMTLLYFIRNCLHLTGSKLGCGEGGCGACTVMLSKCTSEGAVYHFAVNACLTPLCAVHGMAVTTVEGIGSTTTALHPCQERIAHAHGSQCGFCTPGFVMSMYSLLRTNHALEEEEIEEAFQGNLCRCTGYRPILDGFKTFATKSSGCCMSTSSVCCNTNGSNEHSRLFDSSSFTSLDPSQEPIFPAKLLLSGPPKPVFFKGPRVHWYRPTTMEQLLSIRNTFPQQDKAGKPCSRIVVGNTEIGVDVKFKGYFYEVLICPNAVPQLTTVETTANEVVVGGAVTLTELTKEFKQLVKTLPGYKTRVITAILEMLRWFAGQQIRNVCSLGGNICNASPISDLNPLLMAAGATITVASVEGQRSLPVDATFFKGYRQTALQSNEVLVSVRLPFTAENEFFWGYKQSRRREDDIAIVNAGFRVALEPQERKVTDLSLCFGGMSYMTISATQTAHSLTGRIWDNKLLEDGVSLLLKEFPLASNVPGGMPEYRRALTVSFFFKFFWSVTNSLSGASLEQQLQSVIEPSYRPCVKSSQGFQRITGAAESVGKPVMHLSAPLQASGEAHYTDDITPLQGELYAGLVLSTHAHAKITVDWSPISNMEGVHGYACVDDVPGSNVTGLFGDEKVFADGEVTHFGQIIGMVLADNQMLAQRAAKLVKVSYTDLPAIITIEDAIAVQSFFPVVRNISKGDFSTVYEQCPLKLEGETHVGGQDHFYLETHGCLAVPKGESAEMEIFASTQCVNGTQLMAAKALGIPANRVVARVKRIGGGFGGKESRSFLLSTPTAVAANKLKRPIRVILDRNEDMLISGGRHPYLGIYKVGFADTGEIQALDLDMFSNAGASIDLSYGVNDRAITHADNAYSIPNVRMKATACKTNLPSNTAFRGFGGPQGMMIMEQIMTKVASYLGLQPDKVRELNMYKEGDVTPFGMALENCTVRKCWQQVKQVSAFDDRRNAVDKFNRNNRWKKRGLALIPTKFGIAFGADFLNQGGALLHVYTDGSVLLNHGGMEMGQGLHTKMVQVCSHLLDVPLEKVHVSETNSGLVANASPTAASYSTDLYGMAVKDCCDQILERLAPVKVSAPDAGWDAWVKTAYHQRINLTAQGFYITPGLHMDWDNGKGNPYFYFSYGASCSEVEINCLTGDFTVLQTDIVQDVGNSINPAIDIGQVEGAFIQGLGLFTLEQCVYLESGRGSERGQLFTTGPGTYKIPSAQDIPINFNVALLGRAPNPKAIFSSKAVGEPPLFLAASVFFAIHDAISSARKDAGETGLLELDSPATCERIRMACLDHLTSQVTNTSCGGTTKRWTINV